MATRPYPILTVNEKAARAIRALDRPDAATVPIIAVTANAFAEDIAKTGSVCSPETPTTGLMRPFGGGGSNTPWTTGRPSWGTTFPAPG